MGWCVEARAEDQKSCRSDRQQQTLLTNIDAEIRSLDQTSTTEAATRQDAPDSDAVKAEMASPALAAELFASRLTSVIQALCRRYDELAAAEEQSLTSATEPFHVEQPRGRAHRIAGTTQPHRGPSWKISEGG